MLKQFHVIIGIIVLALDTTEFCWR